MTLGDIFKGANISFPAGEQMLQKIRSKGNFKEVRNKQLEKDLNDLIYGTDLSVETEYAKSINSIGESYIQEVLNRIEGASLTGGAGKARSGAAKAAHESTTRASFNQAKNFIAEIENNLKILLDNSNGLPVNQRLKQMKKRIETVNAQIQALQAQYGNRFYLTYKNGKDFKSLKANLILLEQYAELTQLLPSHNALGDSFENTLTEAINNETNKETAKILDYFNVQAKRWGDKSVSRTASTGGLALKITADYTGLAQQGEDVSKYLTGKNISGTGYKITYTPQRSAQSKMDVEINFEDGTSRGLSLKNWANLAGSNEFAGIGETSLLSALIRSGGENDTNNYAFALLSNKENILAQAHKFAEISIVADIVMGLAQENNWASDLVINDRSAKHIYVFNIPALINNMHETLNIGGYDRGYLQSISWGILNNITQDEGRSQEYLQRMFGVLRSRIVQIKLSQTLVSSVAKK